MQWNELYDRDHEPTESQVKEFVNTPLFDNLDSFMRQTYNVKPKLAHSNCSMDNGFWKGWNVKYKKNGKALCTLYPKQGYLLLLIPIGAREMNEAELLMPTCTEHVQEVFEQGGNADRRSLGVEVRDENVMRDVKSLVEIRAKTK